jgi:hypothetical protein
MYFDVVKNDVTPPTPRVNGKCGTKVNECSKGTLHDTADSSTLYR